MTWQPLGKLDIRSVAPGAREIDETDRLQLALRHAVEAGVEL